MANTPEIPDALLKDCKTPEDVGSLYSALLQRIINDSLDAEMDAYLADQALGGNRRNVKLAKTVKGDFGEREIHTPRDCEGSFEPPLVNKPQIRLAG